MTAINARQEWSIATKLVCLLLVISVAVLLPRLGFLEDLEPAGRRTLFILVLAVGLWITDAIPPFATALLIVGFQVFFLGAENQKANDVVLEKYTRAWASPVIWLIMGGFCLSISLSLTGIDRQLFKKFARWFGANNRLFLFGAILIASLLSMFMSNTATTSLVLGILGPTLANPSQTEAMRKSLLVGVPAAASIGGMATIIGSTPNAIAYNFITKQGLDFGFVSWMLVGFPLMILLVPFLWILTLVIFRLPNEPFPPSAIDGVPNNEKEERAVSKRDRHIVLWTFALTVALWASTPWHTLSVSVVSLIPIVVLSVAGILRSQDLRLIPWDTLLLIMGGMSLGESVVDSGLAQYLVDRLHLPSTLHPWLVTLVFGYVSVVFSTFMSNTAAASILIPLGSILVPSQSLELSLAIALASSMATALPVSTPPNAVAYAFGYLKSSDFASIGSVLALIGPPLIATIIWLFHLG